PDDGDAPYPVSIPFLGVRSADATALTTAAGAAVGLTATSVPNPGYRGYASFSSSGPRTGDSAISPNVAAPGVSIASARVGSGNGAEVQSGTSMAAPHVAGVAALTVQAHPGWGSQDISAAITSTADPEQVTGQQVTLGGLGLVDAAQAVATPVTVTGDSFATSSGRLREAALSFGFAEPDVAFVGTRTLTIENHGTTSVTYKLTSKASAQSRPASVSLSARSVTVRPGGQAQLRVTLNASASKVGSSIGADDPSSFVEVSGSVVLTAPSGVLRVPYLLVPRAQSKVDLTTVGRSKLTFAVNQAGKPGRPGSVSVKLSNRRGALGGAADFYTWGLSDARDVSRDSGGGYDLRAVGVQSFATSDTDQQLVFAVNNYSRWSNAASREFDIAIDRNEDGGADLILFSGDSGAIRTGTADGVSEVFILDPVSDVVTPAGYLAQAPTDSSTMLLPVDASTLGLSAAAGTFSYSVTSYDVTGTGGDEMPGTATYNPWAKAVVDGDYVTVAPNRVENLKVAFDRTRYSQQKPLGLMVVALDNQAGVLEAILVSGR
ncbi:MAG: S8 family serine peptidase, partial [Propionicimonas sp.]